ncbi:IclR family transcriptional regulator C-terminal domain-containing protein [Streptomyces sp. NPDC051211]|uniref:IclR family transcriptional regulator n=1 Tax=Streptomyces sp. NPDC051211 TaxID=3154643 RepID=UPI00344F3595
MSDESRYQGYCGQGPAPEVPAGLTALLSELSGPPDFWDRPDGDWGQPTDGCPQTQSEERSHANSCYRLLSKALRRDELEAAANWLGDAVEHEHPGAVFRLAVVIHREYGKDGREDVHFLVAEAARLGHGDAQLLLAQVTGQNSEGDVAFAMVQDPEFIDEIRAALGIAPTADSATSGTFANSDAPHDADLPALQPLLPMRGTRPGQTRPTEPPASADTTEQTPPTWPVTDTSPGRSALWSAFPLRAPQLSVAARQVPGRGPAPGQWRSVERALRILHTLNGSTVALSPAELVKATSLPKAVLEQLLGWLYRRRLAARLADGGYTPGPALLELSVREGGRSEHAMQQTLAALRDAVGAAVYVSGYIDGEVSISRFSDGPDAPRVYEWVDFSASAHASAVGKSLLAQLSYEQRMDHLSRHRAARLTSRTITDHRTLFHDLDGRGPRAPQFDRQEYSTREVCVAVPLPLYLGNGQAECLALSLPVDQQHRLQEAAEILTTKSTTVLLSLLLAGDPPVEPSAQPETGIVVVPPSTLLEPQTPTVTRRTRRSGLHLPDLAKARQADARKEILSEAGTQPDEAVTGLRVAPNAPSAPAEEAWVVAPISEAYAQAG